MDYTETFASVAKMDSIRIVLAIVASKRWEVHHMDVKSEFIHGEIQEDIYMKQPKCFQEDPSLVCRLKKSLYGLKQALGLGMTRWTILCFHLALKHVNMILMCICSMLVTYFKS